MMMMMMMMFRCILYINTLAFCHNNHVQGGIEYQSNRTACVKDKKIVKCKKFLHEKLSSRCVGISFSEAVLMTGYIQGDKEEDSDNTVFLFR